MIRAHCDRLLTIPCLGLYTCGCVVRIGEIGSFHIRRTETPAGCCWTIGPVTVEVAGDVVEV